MMPEIVEILFHSTDWTWQNMNGSRCPKLVKEKLAKYVMAEMITVNIWWEDMEHHTSPERIITFIEGIADSILEGPIWHQQSQKRQMPPAREREDFNTKTLLQRYECTTAELNGSWGRNSSMGIFKRDGQKLFVGIPFHIFLFEAL